MDNYGDVIRKQKQPKGNETAKPAFQAYGKQSLSGTGRSVQQSKDSFKRDRTHNGCDNVGANKYPQRLHKEPRHNRVRLCVEANRCCGIHRSKQINGQQ